MTLIPVASAFFDVVEIEWIDWRKDNVKIVEWDKSGDMIPHNHPDGPVRYHEAYKNRTTVNLTTAVLSIEQLTFSDSGVYSVAVVFDFEPKMFFVSNISVISK